MGFDAEVERCWRIVMPTGEDWDRGDGVPHFSNEQAAMDSRLGEEQEWPPGAKAVQFDAPCVTVTCEECEEDPGAGDVFTQIHCRDEEEARKVARESDWKVTPDGRAYCWDCLPPETPEASDA